MTFNQEVIEKYLNQELDETDLSNFENELRISPSLKEQVLLTKELNEIFSNQDQLSFIDNLKKIEYKGVSQPTPIKPKNKPLSYIAMFSSILLLGIAGYYFLSPLLNTHQGPLPTSDIPSIDTLNVKEEVQKPKIEYAQQEIDPISPVEYSSDLAYDYSIEPQFQPNPDIEALINHANDNNWIIGHFPLDQFAQPGELMTLAFNGQLKSQKAYLDRDVAFYLFNNDGGAYENFVPYKTYYPQINEVHHGYEMDLEEQLALEEGLYYYLIEEIQSEEVLYAGKFESRVSNLF